MKHLQIIFYLSLFIEILVQGNFYTQCQIKMLYVIQYIEEILKREIAQNMKKRVEYIQSRI